MLGKVMIVAAALALSGCAARVLGSNANSVMITQPQGPSQAGEAMQIADRECARYGKRAAVRQMTEYRTSFDCVER